MKMGLIEVNHGAGAFDWKFLLVVIGAILAVLLVCCVCGCCICKGCCRNCRRRRDQAKVNKQLEYQRTNFNSDTFKEEPVPSAINEGNSYLLEQSYIEDSGYDKPNKPS